MIYAVIAAIFLILILSGCVYTYIICFHVPRKHYEDPYQRVDTPQFRSVQHLLDQSTKILESTHCEEVTITSYDGLKLHGRYYAVQDGAPVIIAFHGYRSASLRDCAIGFSLGLKYGYNVLAVDQRAHGMSEGHVITFGIKERYDCQSWISYIKERFGEGRPILLIGISMGAATVLMAADLDLPTNVKGIIADSAYCSPADIIKKVCRDIGYPVKLTYPLIRLGALIFGSFELNAAAAINSAKRSQLPILLIHGEEDLFVPCEMSKKIHASASNTRLYTFPDAGHGLSYLTDPTRYEAICLDFMKDIF